MKPEDNENANLDSTEAGSNSQMSVDSSSVNNAGKTASPEDREPPTLQLEAPDGTLPSEPAPPASGEPPAANNLKVASKTESLDDKVKKGAKGYLMKVGKLMIFFAILGSLLLGFAAYMISSTLNNIVSKIGQYE
jgi:hypothetical protein